MPGAWGGGPPHKIHTITYDALHRLTQQNNTSHSYNGDGVLVQRTRGAGTWTYAQDLVAPLSQMLTVTYNSDPTNYLYGHERLQARSPGKSTSWYHTDALGSVRHLSKDDGTLSGITNYDLWGTIQPSASTEIFRFTGEFQDQGLVHLRARWYAPGTGTFTSRDPFAGFAEMPYSLHPYQYAYSAPTTWVDPSGRVPQHAEQDFRDLTDWLYRALMHNLQDPRLRRIRTLNAIGDTSGGLVRFQCNTGVASLVLDPYSVKLTALRVAVSDPLSKGIFFGAASGYVVAGKQFYDLVKDRGPWDFKHLIEERLGPGITFCAFNGCRTDIDYGVPGNIHFGFVARAGGYYGWEIQAGAGIAEIYDPAHDAENPDFAPYEGEFGGIVTPGGTSFNFGDNPKDHNDVAFGIHLYDTYGAGLTLPQFQQELQVWLPTLKHNVPRQEPVPPDVRRQYPYGVEYFNPS